MFLTQCAEQPFICSSSLVRSNAHWSRRQNQQLQFVAYQKAHLQKLDMQHWIGLRRAEGRPACKENLQTLTRAWAEFKNHHQHQNKALSCSISVTHVTLEIAGTVEMLTKRQQGSLQEKSNKIMCKGLQTASGSRIWPYCGHPVYILRVLRAGTKVTSGRFWSWLLLWRNFCRCLSSWRFFFSCLCCSFLCLLDTWAWGKYFGTTIWFELCFPVNPKINRWLIYLGFLHIRAPSWLFVLTAVSCCCFAGWAGSWGALALAGLI